MLSTNLPDSVRQASNEEAVSVIHAPESFTSWVRRIFFFFGIFRLQTNKNRLPQSLLRDKASRVTEGLQKMTRTVLTALALR